MYLFGRDTFNCHDTVNHKKDEYVKVVDGVTVTTNTVEGFFGNLKRGINGVYHHVGKQHLHRYLAEFDFRYNAREITDAERRDLAIAGTNGKRLMHRDSCGNAVKQECRRVSTPVDAAMLR